MKAEANTVNLPVKNELAVASEKLNLGNVAC